MAFVRFLMLMLVAQTVTYLSLALYCRAARKEQLLRDYPVEAEDREREAFVERALDTYMRGLRPRLAVIVYGLPILALAGYIWWSNFR